MILLTLFILQIYMLNLNEKETKKYLRKKNIGVYHARNYN